MQFLILDIDHSIALLAFAYISATVGFMQVDAVSREQYETVATHKNLIFHFSCV
jgi:hypothetical protein